MTTNEHIGGATVGEVQRYGSVIGVKPEKLEYYKELHANPWPTVNEGVSEANIRNYSIYLTQMDDGNWYLFSYFEYAGDDFEADMAKLSENSEIKRWWKETDPCQIPLENRNDGEFWKGMEEVYHLD
jgi:L-rhamnose mutarotase